MTPLSKNGYLHFYEELNIQHISSATIWIIFRDITVIHTLSKLLLNTRIREFTISMKLIAFVPFSIFYVKLFFFLLKISLEYFIIGVFNLSERKSLHDKSKLIRPLPRMNQKHVFTFQDLKKKYSCSKKYAYYMKNNGSRELYASIMRTILSTYVCLYFIRSLKIVDLHWKSTDWRRIYLKMHFNIFNVLSKRRFFCGFSNALECFKTKFLYFIWELQ